MAYKRRYNTSFGDIGFDVSQRWPEKDIIAAKGRTKNTVGLALSGGGYRSAIFNYGVLKGLHKLDVIPKIDYLSVVSGGSWIGMPFSTATDLGFLFHKTDDHPNLMEEGFESLLPNPGRVAQEMALARRSANYVSNIYGRLLARTFLREHGDKGRTSPLSDATLFDDQERPFLIVNGTANFRRPKTFDITQECFEMTRLYSGSHSLGYLATDELKATERKIRIRDAIAISGAEVALHIPGLGDDVGGFGLSREIVNFAKGRPDASTRTPQNDEVDVADGGHYNNLGVESLINRGCRYIIIVDAEHDPEAKTETRSNQKYSGLNKLLDRIHIPLPNISRPRLDAANQAVHEFQGTAKKPSILYIKLKSMKKFDALAKKKPYNGPNFLENLFDRGAFRFDPQFSTAKLDYDFAEHRNLSELGEYIVTKEGKGQVIKKFVNQAS